MQQEHMARRRLSCLRIGSKRLGGRVERAFFKVADLAQGAACSHNARGLVGLVAGLARNAIAPRGIGACFSLGQQIHAVVIKLRVPCP